MRTPIIGVSPVRYRSWVHTRLSFFIDAELLTHRVAIASSALVVCGSGRVVEW